MSDELIRFLERKTLPLFEVPDRARLTAFQNQVAGKILQADLMTSVWSSDGSVQVWPFPHGRAEFRADTGSLWIESEALWRLPRVTPTGLEQWEELSLGANALDARVTDLFKDAGGQFGDVTLATRGGWKSGTKLVVWRRNPRLGQRPETTYRLDEVGSKQLTLSSEKYGLSNIPLSGPDAKLVARLKKDEAVGASVAIPALTGAAEERPMVGRAEADDEIRRRFSMFDDLLFDAALSYRVLQENGRRWLAPCWTYDATVRMGDEYFPLTGLVVPAVGFQSRQILHRGADCAASPDLEDKVQQPGNGPLCLMSWIGNAGANLKWSPCIYESTATTLRDSGWNVSGYGELSAAVSAWSGKNADVNRVDLGIFVGHGKPNLLRFGDAALSNRNCRFGGHLKWAITDACGVLQHSPDFTSAFSRWAPAFGGLRMLLGFGSVQDNNPVQLPNAITGALQGRSLAREWFKSCCDAQSTWRSGTSQRAWVAGMFAVGADGITTVEDRLTEASHSLSPAIGPDPDILAGIWIPT